MPKLNHAARDTFFGGKVSRLTVDLLDLADRVNVVAELAGALGALHERDELPDIDALRERFAPRPTLMPSVHVVMPAAAVYDELLEAA